jgi:type IV pilus assembly protein PilQ
MRWFFVLCVCLCLSEAVMAQEKLTLNVESASLPDVILFLGKAAHLSLTVSPRVRGSVSVHWQQVDPEAALSVLLMMNGLMRESYHGLWYVATADEFIQTAGRQEKWQAANEAAQPLATHSYSLRYANAKNLASFLESSKQTLLSKRGLWRFDERTNGLAVTDIASRLALMDAWVRRLDVPVKQIMIEARLASVDQSAESALGIDFASVAGKPSAAAPGFYNIAIAHLPDGSMLDVKLAALLKEGKADLIASPRLFTVNLQPASIESGQEVPYQHESESGGTTVTFKKAVLSLDVVPQLLPGGRVMLALKITQDRPSTALSQNGAPLIDTRAITTEVLVKHGQTVVLGGIYEDDHETEVKRLPYLSALPVLGGLFQVKTEANRKRELLIFVTPRLIAQSP